MIFQNGSSSITILINGHIIEQLNDHLRERTRLTAGREAAFGVIETLKYRFLRLIKIFADGGYRGELVENVKKFCGWDMEITLRSDKAKGFEVLPMRWVVERSFSWLENFRRLAKDYEYSTQMSETMIYLAFTTIMLHRIKKLKQFLKVHQDILTVYCCYPVEN